MSDTTPAVVSPALKIIAYAIQQVEDVMTQAEKSQKLLEQNLTQVQSQRIGLNAQRAMLVELQNRVGAAEQQAATPVVDPTPVVTPTTTEAAAN